MNEPLTHAHDVVDSEAEAFVELNHCCIGCSDLEIDLGATCISQKFFSFVHDASGKAATLIIRVNCEVVDPASVALIARHASCDNFAIHLADQKPLGIDF